MPLPAHLGSQQQEKRGAEEFLERKRQQAMEVRDVESLSRILRLILFQDVLKRDEWMLVPPSKSDRLRQNDNGEWRLADEPSREKRWKENSEVPDDYGRSALEARKWQRTKGEIQRAVSEYNVRGFNHLFVSLPRSRR